MTELESANPNYESSVKLCASIKKYKCLHDQNSCHKYPPPECEAAWRLVAKECNETIEFCKNRWKNLRRSFFEGLKRRGNYYYLHEHLVFLLEEDQKKSNLNPEATLNDETNSTISDSFKKNDDDSESEMGSMNMYDDEDIKTISSQTRSADESNKVTKKSSQVGVFIINEIDEVANKADQECSGRRSSNKRSSKRPLDLESSDEFSEENRDKKRSCRPIKCNRKTLTNESEKHNQTSQWTSQQIKIRLNRLKAHAADNKAASMKANMVDSFTYTDFKQTRDCSTQYEFNSTDFDDIFMDSINTQLKEMNARQKMNFKRKIYQSLLEVFDDATDFPNTNETLQLPHKQPQRVVNTTTGELRLMRELVALVQAAKITPEIMNAKEKIKTAMPLLSKQPLKMPVPIVENRSIGQTSPLSLSPSIDDEDFHIDNIDDDDDAALPHSWDEIKAKPVEPPKATTEENVMGLSRRVLQKVVRVSGPGGSTIVARDGDKKRIYRIYPKSANPNENRVLPTRSDSSVGTFFVTAPKNTQNTKIGHTANTFFVSSPKNPQDLTANTFKINNHLTLRSVNNKPTNNANEITKPVNKTNQPVNSNTNSSINGQTSFKNVNSTNRILSSSTGYFKMVPSPKPITPTNIVKSTSTPTTGATANSTVSKVLTNKMPMRPMLPPVSNNTTKRTHTGPQVMQRRYSICGAPPVENVNTTSNSANNNNGNPQANSSLSQIKISEPISLNTKTPNAQTTSSSQSNTSNNNAKSLAETTEPVEDVKFQIKSLETCKEPVGINEPATSAREAVIGTANSTPPEEIPILETAGTVEADVLDPLFVKPPTIKSEPVYE